jgi:hypothetical protein
MPGYKLLTAGPALALAMIFPVIASAQQPAAPLGELFAEDANGRLLQPVGAGMSVASGSELKAGVTPARLSLKRGGEVRICPKTSVNLNAARFGLMFAMSSGAIEIEYQLFQRGSDMIITPDFNIQLAGPGKYHFALSTNERGDTCVKPLPGNAAPVQLSELMGPDTHRVNPQSPTLFHDGRLAGSTPLPADEPCGCAETAPLQTAATPQPPQEDVKLERQISPAIQPPIVPATTNAAETATRDQSHAEVEAPFVFSAREGAGAIKPYSVAKLSFSSLPNVFFVQETVDPVVLPATPAVVSVPQKSPVQPPDAQSKAPEKKKKKGLFGRVFGRLFGR